MSKQRGRQRSDLVAVLRAAVLRARAQGRSERSVALAAGVSAPQLHRFARGERTLTLPVASRLAAFFGLELVRRKPAKRVRKPAGAFGAAG